MDRRSGLLAAVGWVPVRERTDAADFWLGDAGMLRIWSDGWRWPTGLGEQSWWNRCGSFGLNSGVDPLGCGRRQPGRMSVDRFEDRVEMDWGTRLGDSTGRYSGTLGGFEGF